MAVFKNKERGTWTAANAINVKKIMIAKFTTCLRI